MPTPAGVPKNGFDTRVCRSVRDINCGASWLMLMPPLLIPPICRLRSAAADVADRQRDVARQFALNVERVLLHVSGLCGSGRRNDTFCPTCVSSPSELPVGRSRPFGKGFDR